MAAKEEEEIFGRSDKKHAPHERRTTTSNSINIFQTPNGTLNDLALLRIFPWLGFFISVIRICSLRKREIEAPTPSTAAGHLFDEEEMDM